LKYYTIDEAASLLSNKPTRDWLLMQMISPDEIDKSGLGTFITPSVYFDKPVLLRTQDTGKSLPGWFFGWFEIDGIYERGKVHNREICFDRPARYLSLMNDDVKYIPVQSLKIPLEHVHIRQDELALFAELTGRKLEKEPEKLKQETDKEIVRRLQEAGIPPHEIAGDLRKTFPNITYHRIGALLHANSDSHIEIDSVAKRGQRLIIKWKASQEK